MLLSFTITEMEMDRERLWYKVWLGEALVIVLLIGKESCKWLPQLFHAVFSPQHVIAHLLPSLSPADGIFKGSRAKSVLRSVLCTAVQRHARKLGHMDDCVLAKIFQSVGYSK